MSSTLTPSQRVGWNQATDQSFIPAAIGASLLTSPVSQVATDNLTYYVDFTPQTTPVGNSPLNALVGVVAEATGFSFQDTQTITLSASGIATGKASLGPLTLTFTQQQMTPALVQALASGALFGEVDVLGYTSSGALAVDDVFEIAGVTSVSAGSGGETTVTLQYEEEAILPYDTTNSPPTPTDAGEGWNGETNTELKFLPTITNGSPLSPLLTDWVTKGGLPHMSSAGSLTYFVRFTLNTPNSGSPFDGKTLYQLTGFSSADLNSLNLSTLRAGKASFDPLTLTFTQQALTPALLQMLGYGTGFAEVDVLGYTAATDTSAGTLATYYSFGLVGVGGLSADDSGQTTATLQYGAEEVQTTTTNSNGTTTTTTAAWNAVKNIAGFSTNGTATAIPVAAAANLPLANVSPPASGLTYYVRFILNTAPAGNALDGTTLYQLTGFSWQDLQLLNIGAGGAGGTGGTGAGRASFDPLTLTFTQQALTPALLEMLGSGAPIDEVDVLGYTAATDTSAGTLAVDDSFGFAGVSNLTADGNGQVTAALQYGSEEIQITTTNLLGNTTTTQAAWNSPTDSAIFSTDKTTSATPATAPATLSGQTVSVTSNLVYYVFFTPQNGDGKTPFDHEDYYELTGFSWQDLQSFNIDSSGTAHGMARFDPLTLTFTQHGLEPALLQMLAEGTAFQEVDVLGYTPGSSGTLAVDYSFGLVGTGDLTIDSSGQTTAKLQYGAEEIQTTTTNQIGTTTINKAAWNLINNNNHFYTGTTRTAPIGAPTTLPTIDTTAVQVGGLTYYVRFTLNTTPGSGNPLDGQTLYQLAGFSAEDSNSLAISASGTGAGRASFGPLTLTFTQQALTPALFQMLTSGTAFQEVDVLGYTSENALAVDYSFGLAGASSLSTDSSGQTTAALQYWSEEAQAYLINRNGTTDTTDKIAPSEWNALTNTSVFSTNGTAAATPIAAATTLPRANLSLPATGSLTYFVRFTPTSALNSLDGKTLYQLTSFSSQDTQSFKMSTSGIGAGKASLGPLSLTLTQPALTPDLQFMLTSGASFQEIDIFGYDSSRNLVIDYSFTSAGASSLSNDSSGNTVVAFQYGAESIQTGTADAICFMPGTLIRTPQGERAVESLAIGDLVLTAAGEAQPVLWIGRQTVCRHFGDPLRVLPIRITTGALDENQPVRDLLVSPDHALLVGGVLIQAGALVNGTTIRREENVPIVFTYYHVELADHALILAEGVAAETFVDNVDRMGFDNWEEHLALYPQGLAIEELPLPRAKSHRQVPMAIRRLLAARAAALWPAGMAA